MYEGGPIVNDRNMALKLAMEELEKSGPNKGEA